MLDDTIRVSSVIEAICGKHSIMGTIRIDEYTSRIYFKHLTLKGECDLEFEKTDVSIKNR